MKLTFTFMQGPTVEKQVVSTTTSENITMADMRKLWEIEQFLNALPGCPLRVHIDLANWDAFGPSREPLSNLLV